MSDELKACKGCGGDYGEHLSDCPTWQPRALEAEKRLLEFIDSPAGDLLATKQKLETANRLCDELQSDLTAAQNRLAELENPVHTCSGQCQRPMCVLRRERDEANQEVLQLRSQANVEAEELDAQLTAAKQEVERLRSGEIYKELKSTIHELNKGLTTAHAAIAKKDTALKECFTAIESLPKDTLGYGQNDEQMWPLTDELMSNIQNALSTTPPEATEKQPFTCFNCRDGNTPLYCLNCAGDVLAMELVRDGEIVDWLEKNIVRVTCWETGNARALVHSVIVGTNESTGTTLRQAIDSAMEKQKGEK